MSSQYIGSTSFLPIFSFQFKEGVWYFLLPDLNREETSSFSGKTPTLDLNGNL